MSSYITARLSDEAAILAHDFPWRCAPASARAILERPAERESFGPRPLTYCPVCEHGAEGFCDERCETRRVQMSRTDVIDSRDLLTELRDLLDDPHYDYRQAANLCDAWDGLDEEDQRRVEHLREVLDALPESTGDSPTGNSWGSTLVHEGYFTEHARELADDIGAVDSDASWPNTYIDWSAAAEALKADYTPIEFDGETYYAR